MNIRPVGLRTLEQLSKKTYSELFSLWLGIIFIFGMYFFILTLLFPAHGVSIDPELSLVSTLLECMYFSVMTATTTGYGDLIPHGFSRALACVEVVLAFGTFTIFLAKLVNHEQELEKVQRLPAAKTSKPRATKKR